MRVGQYSKFIVALGGFVAVLVQVVEDGVVDSAEVGVLATAAVVAGGVFFKRNTVVADPEGPEPL
jgi:hypothetical protein